MICYYLFDMIITYLWLILCYFLFDSMGAQISGPPPNKRIARSNNGHTPFKVVPGQVNTGNSCSNCSQQQVNQPPQPQPQPQNQMCVQSVVTTIPPGQVRGNVIYQPAPVIVMHTVPLGPTAPQSQPLMNEKGQPCDSFGQPIYGNQPAYPPMDGAQPAFVPPQYPGPPPMSAPPPYQPS